MCFGASDDLFMACGHFQGLEVGSIDDGLLVESR
jgi:hypothetical protein